MDQPISTEASLAEALRQSMRHMVGGVTVITAGVGEERTGLAAITARSLSIDPPKMLICVRTTASAWPVIRDRRHFAVNILAEDQLDVAERFAGTKGVKGAARYDNAEWTTLPSGASGLKGALAVVDCEVEEMFERHGSAIIIGNVLAASSGNADDPLIYAHGGFLKLPLPEDRAFTPDSVAR